MDDGVDFCIVYTYTVILNLPLHFSSFQIKCQFKPACVFSQL